MTLKEKFKDVEIGKGMSDRLEQIADEFAIGFTKWISLKGYKYYSNGWANFNTKAVNEKELLEMYKKEKGL
jgi:hypothetical protein